jgi:putative FmdB family regulatory protein
VPTYEYSCTTCGHQLEAVQKFSDDPLTECPECGGALRKVYGAVGIVLKGSGFYKTDSRAAAKSNGRDGSKSESSTDSTSGDKADTKSADTKNGDKGGDSKKGDSKKVDAKPAASAASSS